MLLLSIAGLSMPSMAVAPGNLTPGAPVGPVQTIIWTQAPTTPQVIVPPSTISTAANILPIWVIIGIILIIIAISGLLWRYFHPKYVAPEENE